MLRFRPGYFLMKQVLEIIFFRLFYNFNSILKISLSGAIFSHITQVLIAARVAVVDRGFAAHADKSFSQSFMVVDSVG
jgi:hypothetical protein